jgi:hypothetical protein
VIKEYQDMWEAHLEWAHVHVLRDRGAFYRGDSGETLKIKMESFKRSQSKMLLVALLAKLCSSNPDVTTWVEQALYVPKDIA